MKKKILHILIISALLITIVFTAVACGSSASGLKNNSNVLAVATSSTRIIDTFSRNKPDVKDGGLQSYPGFDNVIKDKAEREKIYAENQEMMTYDKIDGEGNLYILNEDKEYVAKGTRLYKHSAADGMLEESISDDAQGTVARIALKPSRYGNNLTQLYIPAGEVVTVVLDAETVKRGGLRVDIGLGTQRGGSTNIPAAEGGTYDYARMPIPRKSLLLKEAVNYIGSPIGGTLYIMSESLMNHDSNYKYEITVIGAVRAPEYYFGITNLSDWDNIKKFPGIYFHLEVRSGVRLTMPASFIRDKSAEEMYNLGQFYENTAMISNKLSNGDWFSNHPVDIVFDSYVFVGAAVAVVGADVCFCPTDWASSAVDYNGLMRDGSWGVLHEFNHHHQGWGATGGGEVTNNVANIMTYLLNTNIATFRYDGGGLGDSWKKYTDPYQSLKETLNRYANGNTNKELDMYVNLLHNFGEEFMYKLAKSTRVNENQSENYEKFMSQFYVQASKLSGFDMLYYLKDICKFSILNESIEEISALKLPMFLPIASPYQTAVAINNGDWVELGRPYHVPYGAAVEVDFAKYNNLPNINAVIDVDLSSANGRFQQIEGLKYIYTPSANAKIDRVILNIRQSSATANTIDQLTKLRLDFLGDPSVLTISEWENTGYADIEGVLNSGVIYTEPKNTQYVTKGVINTKNQNVLSVMNGKIILPKGRTKLVLAGDDLAKLVISGEKERYAAVVNAAQGYKLDDPLAIIDITLKESMTFNFNLIMLNKQGSGYAKIGMVKYSTLGTDKEVVVDITNDYIRHSDYDVDEYTRLYYSQRLQNNPSIVASGTLMSEMLNPIVTIAPASYSATSTPDKMIDGDRNTLFHSVTNLKFPDEVVIDFGHSLKFNNLTILPKQSDDMHGFIKEYEVYYSDNPSSFASLSMGESEHNRKGIEITTTIKQARYIKIVAKSVHSSNYFAISEVEPSIKHSSTDIIVTDNPNLNYFGQWNDNNYGNVLNGNVKETDSGAVTLKFKGTALSIYGNIGRSYGNAIIRLDGKKIAELNCYSDANAFNQCLYIITDLADKTHTLEISNYSNSPININYIALTLSGDVSKGGLSLPLTISIVVASCVLLLVILIIVLIVLMRKKSAKKENEKEKHVLNNVVFVPDDFMSKPLIDGNINIVNTNPKPIITKFAEPELIVDKTEKPKEVFKPIIKAKPNKSVEGSSNRVNVAEDNSIEIKSSKVNLPVAKETKVPVAKETKPSVAKETKAPVAKETKASVAKETKASVAKETKPPAAKETKAPVAKEPKPPVTKETKTPIAKETKASVAKETKPPVAKEPKPPVVKETKTPIAKETKASVSKETKTPNTEVPKSSITKIQKNIKGGKV